ncbi:LysR family transcriptional regulator [Cytophagaceae bacterium ABcell3]|nr:LysR family transcriptional regulator [Cytophagaceae bacterium ABcell3]
MNYTLHQLQIFLKIAQLGSITKASEELFISQPAVSIQLKKFQEQFDIPLTEVVGRKLYVTDFGKEVAAAAEKIIDEAYAINYKALSFKGILSGSLKISVASTGQYVMPYFLADFIHKNKGVELKIDVTNKLRVIKSLEKNEIDFALISVLPDKPGIESEELVENKLYLVGNTRLETIPKTHSKSVLEELPLIYREVGSATRNVMERFIKENELSIKKKMELTSNEAVKQAVIAGLGYSVMPLIGIKNELNNGSLQIIPIDGLPIRSKWRLTWLKDKKMSPVATKFIHYIKSEKSNIIKNEFDWLKDY